MTKIVVPGQVVADTPQRAAYTYTDGIKTYATVVSLQSDEGKLIPLEGPYEPLAEDVIVGFVTDVRFAGYSVDIGSPYNGFLSSRDSRATFKLGDIITARIINVDEVKSIDLADGRALTEGRIEKISPVKVPRLIGKKNSMINMISGATLCSLVVGRNGFIFVSHTGDHALVQRAIDLIEAQAHTTGLTDRMAAFLSKETGKTIEPGMAPAPSTQSSGYGSQGDSSQGGYGRREGGRSGGFGGPRREGGFRSGPRRDGPRQDTQGHSGLGAPTAPGAVERGGFHSSPPQGGDGSEMPRRPLRPHQEGEQSASSSSNTSGSTSNSSPSGEGMQ
jgi:exosome complex component RRP4